MRSYSFISLLLHRLSIFNSSSLLLLTLPKALVCPTRIIRLTSVNFGSNCLSIQSRQITDYAMSNRQKTLDPAVFTIDDLKTLGTARLSRAYAEYYNEGAMDLVTYVTPHQLLTCDKSVRRRQLTLIKQSARECSSIQQISDSPKMFDRCFQPRYLLRDFRREGM